MANEQNLRPFRSASEARESGKKGGKKSGEVRRKRKTLKDELLALLAESDEQKKMSIALLRQAQRGNVKAYEVLRDTIGEKPVDRFELTEDVPRIVDDIGGGGDA